MEDLINKAEHEIHLQTYSFNNDETGHRIANAIINAAKRGVSIYMVLDAYGSKDIGEQLKADLLQAGIKLRFFGAFGSGESWAWGRRLHHKIVVADRHRCLIGGINISNHYSTEGFEWAWFDFALIIEGTVAQNIVRICKQVYAQWFGQFQKNFPPFKKHGHIEQPIDIQLRQNDWLRSKNQIAQSYAKALKAAKEEVIIANSYFLPGIYFRRLLKGAAKRGAKVKVLLPAVSDVPMVHHAMQYLYRYMLRNNIEIYEWQPSVLHAKIACVDGVWSTVGSYNLNYLSAYASIEFNVCVLNEDFGKQFTQHLHQLLQEACKKIDKDDFMKKSSWWKLFTYWISFRILKLSEVLLISFPGQHFFKRNVYA